MMAAYPLDVPPIARGCRITVVIPARNEAAHLRDALAAFGRQRDASGEAIVRERFDVIVFANNCRDQTADIARRFAAKTSLPVYVVEADLPPEDAHIGMARKHVMDLAAQRFLTAGLADGLIASTDSDTIVNDDWIAATLHEATNVDAVAGHVTLAQDEQERLIAPVRLLYARELTYRRLIADVEALIDPVPEDPLPRHSSFVGASFAVRARTYVAAGALPPLPRLEDLEFRRALRLIDARIRHSTLVRAGTSGRLRARVEGGFGSFIADLHACAGRGHAFLVEHPQTTLDTLLRRAALRRAWQTNGSERSTFGSFHEEALANMTVPQFGDVRIDVAIDGLRIAAQRYLTSSPGAHMVSNFA